MRVRLTASTNWEPGGRFSFLLLTRARELSQPCCRFGSGLPEWAALVTAPMVIVGHNWTVLLRFRGGKGAACLIGICLALAPARNHDRHFAGGNCDVFDQERHSGAGGGLCHCQRIVPGGVAVQRGMAVLAPGWQQFALCLVLTPVCCGGVRDFDSGPTAGSIPAEEPEEGLLRVLIPFSLPGSHARRTATDYRYLSQGRLVIIAWRGPSRPASPDSPLAITQFSAGRFYAGPRSP